MSELPRAKGGRPIFLGDAVIDDLLSITMALTQELAVMRERHDTLERILLEQKLISPDAIEDYRASEAVDLEREAWRRDYLDRVLFAVQSRAQGQASQGTVQRYEDVVADVGGD